MDLFGRKKIKLLEKELEFVKQNLLECHIKLAERQEHINKTNAYWKKRVRDLVNSNKDKTNL